MLPVEVLGVHMDGIHPPVVILRNEERVLLIAVGPNEAEAIRAGLAGHDFGRPMTHDLICNLLAGLRGDLKSVNVYKLENDTFYAYLNIEQRNTAGQVDQVLRVDSRPSDSIAIATRTGAPIFVAEEVMDAAGQDVSIIGMQEEGDEDEEEGPDFEQ